MTELLSRLFVRRYRDVQDPKVRAAYGTLAGTVGIVLNILLFASKLTVGLLFGSVAIVGDAVNNLTDVGSQVLSLISFRVAAKPADREHPYGHARMEYVTSMIVSFLVLLIGGELLKESVNKIFSPALPERSWIAAAVLLGSIMIKLWLFLFNRKLGKKLDSTVMRATAADSLSDALSTSAVLLSTLILLLFPHLNWNLDAYMGVLVAIFILISGFRILNETKSSILGEAPSEEIVKQIQDVVEQYPEALGIHDLTVHNYGVGHVIAALHIEVDGSKDIFEAHDMIDNIERQLRRECGIEATIHMDPIVTDDEETNALREQVKDCLLRVGNDLHMHDFRFVKGTTHSNLIFDVVVPFEEKRSDGEIKEAIADEISRLDPNYFTVITVDRA